ERVVGGCTGGSHPNTIPIEHFRGVSGCCSGTAPQAYAMVWDAATVAEKGAVTVNLFIDKEVPEAKVETEFPNEGKVSVTAKKDCDVRIRIPAWAGERITALRDKAVMPLAWQGNLLSFPGLKKGSKVEIAFPLEDRVETEIAKGTQFDVAWRGSHVVWITPEGPTISLYLRDANRQRLRDIRLKKKTGKITATQQG
ncbi:MAG: hypothetical protein AAB215_08380, partial [Planctomycetota bacterium]